MLFMNSDAYSMDALESLTMRLISHSEQDCKKLTYACIIGVMLSGVFHVNGAPYQGSVPLWYSASQIERRLAARRMILSGVVNCMVYPFKIYSAQGQPPYFSLDLAPVDRSHTIRTNHTQYR